VLQAYINPGQMNLWLSEDTPGLAYSVQTRTNLINDSWQDVSVTATDTNTIWSAEVDLPPDSGSGYFRINAVPTPATSPPWPLQ